MFAQEIIGRGAGDRAFTTVLSYSEADPYQVVFHFVEDGEDWIFGRDILVEAFERGVAGEGEVRVRTNGANLSMTFLAMCREGGMVIDYPKGEVAEFLNESLEIVSLGDESSAFDKVLGDDEIAGWFFDAI